MAKDKTSPPPSNPSRENTTAPVRRVYLRLDEVGDFLRKQPFTLLKIENRKTGTVYFPKQ